MRIEVQDDYRIAVELTKDDMCELDITYDDLDYSNIETRRVLWTVLDEASQTIGRNINLSEKMLIEAIPATSGGCIIYFTVLPQAHGAAGGAKMIKREGGAVVCEFLNVDDLYSAADALKRNAYDEKSELYAYERKYRLILYPKIEEEQAVERLLCEYGDVLLKGKMHFLSRTSEFWKLLAQPDAIGKLCRAEKSE